MMHAASKISAEQPQLLGLQISLLINVSHCRYNRRKCITHYGSNPPIRIKHYFLYVHHSKIPLLQNKMQFSPWTSCLLHPCLSGGNTAIFTLSAAHWGRIGITRESQVIPTNLKQEHLAQRCLVLGEHCLVLCHRHFHVTFRAAIEFSKPVLQQRLNKQILLLVQ